MERRYHSLRRREPRHPGGSAEGAHQLKLDLGCWLIQPVGIHYSAPAASRRRAAHTPTRGSFMRILISTLLLVPAVALASSAFDGTWKGRVDSFKVTGKPDVFVIAAGTYTCTSCIPEIKIQADGADHAVTGHDYYDTVAVKIVDATTVERTNKMAGKVTGTNSVTASADGSTLTGKFTDYTGEKPGTFTYTEKRVAAAPAGAH